MRITKFTTEISEDHLPLLVKEKSFNYATQEARKPQDISKMLNDLFRLNKQTEEYVYMVCTNTAGRIIGIFELSHGTVNLSLLSPREIYLKALLCGAVNIIICHNHPSGDTSPSTNDFNICNNIKKVGAVLNIPLIDFIIIGESYYSFKEKSLL